MWCIVGSVASEAIVMNESNRPADDLTTSTAATCTDIWPPVKIGRSLVRSACMNAVNNPFSPADIVDARPHGR
jgi:hypothetical protein